MLLIIHIEQEKLHLTHHAAHYSYRTGEVTPDTSYCSLFIQNSRSYTWHIILLIIHIEQQKLHLTHHTAHYSYTTCCSLLLSETTMGWKSSQAESGQDHHCDPSLEELTVPSWNVLCLPFCRNPYWNGLVAIYSRPQPNYQWLGSNPCFLGLGI